MDYPSVASLMIVHFVMKKVTKVIGGTFFGQIVISGVLVLSCGHRRIHRRG